MELGRSDGDGSYLVSVSDAMAGLLFIFVLVLIAFAIRFQTASDEHHQVALQQSQVIESLTNTDAVRRTMLDEIQQALLEEGIAVQIDLDQGVLHLPEAILFPSGSATLKPEGERALISLASVLIKILPCYTAPPPWGDQELQCDTKHAGKLETLFIEGHTDDIPISNAFFSDNWHLSTARAIRTFQTLKLVEPKLDQLTNTLDQPIFSVSGYAEQRPVEPNDTPDGRQKNRRVDLRFVMISPQAPMEIDGAGVTD